MMAKLCSVKGTGEMPRVMRMWLKATNRAAKSAVNTIRRTDVQLSLFFNCQVPFHLLTFDVGFGLQLSKWILPCGASRGKRDFQCVDTKPVRPRRVRLRIRGFRRRAWSWPGCPVSAERAALRGCGTSVSRCVRANG